MILWSAHNNETPLKKFS